jgi:transposase-like protein
VARPRTKHDAVCHTAACAFYLKQENPHLIKRGTNRAGHQRFYCNQCRTYSVQTKGTAMYRMRLGVALRRKLLQLIARGDSLASIGRQLRLNKNTVSAWTDRIAAVARLGDLTTDATGLLIDERSIVTALQRRKRSRAFTAHTAHSAAARGINGIHGTHSIRGGPNRSTNRPTGSSAKTPRGGGR